MRQHVSLAPGLIAGTVLFDVRSALYVEMRDSPFAESSRQTMLPLKNFETFSRIVLFATMTIFALQSSMMKDQSLSCWASYIGTIAAPRPKQAYAMTAHSTRLSAM